jgi:hypothetical protein
MCCSLLRLSGAGVTGGNRACSHQRSVARRSREMAAGSQMGRTAEFLTPAPVIGGAHIRIIGSPLGWKPGR